MWQFSPRNSPKNLFFGISRRVHGHGRPLECPDHPHALHLLCAPAVEQVQCTFDGVHVVPGVAKRMAKLVQQFQRNRVVPSVRALQPKDGDLQTYQLSASDHMPLRRRQMLEFAGST